MAKKKPPPKKTPDRQTVRQRARGDVALALLPQKQLLQRERSQAIRDTGQRTDALRALYGGLQNTLGGLTKPEDRAMAGISGDLQHQLQSFAGQLGSSGPAGELAAAGGLFGSIGADALGQLASDRTRNVGYNTSAMRQGAQEGLVGQRNARTDLFNSLSDIAQQRSQLGAQFAPQFLSHLGDLRDTLFQQNLANREYQLRVQQQKDAQAQNDALVQFLQQQIGGGLGTGGLGGGGGGTGGGGGGSGGGGGPQPGTGGSRGGDTGSGGGTSGAQANPFQMFVTGARGWKHLNSGNKTKALNRINDYWVQHRNEPAFASLLHYASQHPGNPTLPAAMHTPQALVDLIRQFYYGPHTPGSPGGKPLP